MPNEEQRESAHRRCARCGSSRLHRTHRRGKVEKFLVLLGGKVWRCEACRVRFVRWWKWPIFSEKAEQRVRQVWQLCVVLAGALFVVYALLWMMNRGGGSPTEGG